MSSEPEKDIEKQIRLYADERRREAGDSFALSEEAHALLMKEAERQFPKSVLRPTSLEPEKPSILPLLFRRVALLIPFAALLVFTTKVWWKQRQPMEDMAMMEKQAETPPMELSSMEEMPEMATSRPATMAEPLADLSPDTLKEPALPSSQPSFSYRMKRESEVEGAPATTPPTPMPKTSPVSTAPEVTAGATVELRKEVARKTVAVGRSAAMETGKPAVTSATAAPVIRDPLVQDYEIPGLAKREGLRANFNSPEGAAMLTTFQLKRSEDQLQLTTPSGQQLTGPLYVDFQPPEPPRATSLRERLQNELKQASQPAVSNRHLFFRLTGEGEDAGKPVTVQGNLVPLSTTQAPTITNLQQLQLHQYRIEGLLFEGTNQALINALPSGIQTEGR